MKALFILGVFILALAVTLIGIVFYKERPNQEFKFLLKGKSNTAVLAVQDARTGESILSDPEGLQFFTSMIQTAEFDLAGPIGRLNPLLLTLASGAKVKVDLIVDQKKDVMSLTFPFFSEDPSFFTLRPTGKVPPSLEKALNLLRSR